MNTRPQLLGAVLVGGRSTRMGRPKWELSVAGVPMAMRAAAALAPHVETIAAVAPDDTPRMPGALALRDRGCGPLGAVEAVLECAMERGYPGAFVLACDLPLVSAGVLGALAKLWVDEDVVAAVDRGRLQPLCALWSVSALPWVRSSLASGHLSVLETVAWLRVREVGENHWRRGRNDGEALLNVNTPSDLDRARTIASDA